MKDERVELSTFNGFKVEVVPAGTELRDVAGSRKPIVIDDRTIGVGGNRLYCTDAIWTRLKAGTKDTQKDVKATDSTIDAEPKPAKPKAAKRAAKPKAKATEPKPDAEPTGEA